MNEAWKEFYNKQDWSYVNRAHWPTSQECFNAGFEAAMQLSIESDKEFLLNADIETIMKKIAEFKENNKCN